MRIDNRTLQLGGYFPRQVVFSAQDLLTQFERLSENQRRILVDFIFALAVVVVADNQYFRFFLNALILLILQSSYNVSFKQANRLFCEVARQSIIF